MYVLTWRIKNRLQLTILVSQIQKWQRVKLPVKHLIRSDNKTPKITQQTVRGPRRSGPVRSRQGKVLVEKKLSDPLLAGVPRHSRYLVILVDTTQARTNIPPIVYWVSTFTRCAVRSTGIWLGLVRTRKDSAIVSRRKNTKSQLRNSGPH